jgi:hypothetical protein
MVVVDERVIADLAVVLRLEGTECVIDATDANSIWTMRTEDRAKALEMFHHPYVFQNSKNTKRFDDVDAA